MTFYNIKNPDASVYGSGDWIKVDSDNTKPEKSEITVDNKYSKVWNKINSLKRPIDAGRLQKALEDSGLEVEHDPNVVPNGITTTTAGILIVFRDVLTPSQMVTLNNVMKQVEKDSKDDFFTPLPTTDNDTITKLVNNEV